MTTLQEAVKQAVAGEPIDPSYLEAEPDRMSAVYARVYRYFAAQASLSIRLSNYAGVHDRDGGRIGKLVAKVPGAVRFDGCCTICGEEEFHTAGWTNDEAGDAARAQGFA